MPLRPRVVPELPYTNEAHDGRRKLLPSQHKDVKAVYNELHSLKKTADHFGVSKRLISLIVNPASKQRMQQQHKEKQSWREYYDKDKRKEYMRTYRAKKRALGFIQPHIYRADQP